MLDFTCGSSTELWVYTGSHDDVARLFYISLSFEVLAPASDYAPAKTTTGITSRRFKGTSTWKPLIRIAEPMLVDTNSGFRKA
jgi:hypothetical protein